MDGLLRTMVTPMFMLHGSGAFEIPLVAPLKWQKGKYDAVIRLGADSRFHQLI